MTSPALEALIPISTAAQDLLDTVVATFDSYGVELPERRLITIGSVSVETPVLAVMYGRLAVGLPGNDFSSPVGFDNPRTMTFNVEVWRQTPGIKSPKTPQASVITDAAAVVMDDSWILLEAAYSADSRNQGRGIVAAVTVSPPQGGMQGVALSLELQVP